jgi:Cu/Ag efflux pump CusA
VSADSKDELADKLKRRLKTDSNMEINLHNLSKCVSTNVSGTRSDIVKVFGEDLDVFWKAREIKKL